MLRYINILAFLLFSMPFILFADDSNNQFVPSIFCDEPTYDFGEMDNMSKVEHTFVLKNTGNAKLIISRVKPACGCTVAKLSSREIVPGETASLKTILSLKNRHGHQRKSIKVQSNDPKNPNLLLYLKGRAVTDIEIKPRNVNFRLQSQTNSAVKTVEISSKKSLVITEVISSSAIVNPTLEHIEDNHKYTLTIALAKNIPKGLTQAEVKLKCKNHRDIVIPVSVMRTGVLSFAPKVLVIRPANNRPITRYIIVRAGIVKKFKLIDVDVPDEQINASITSLGNYGYRIKLTNIPPLKELDGKTVLIKTDVAEMPEIKIPFKVFP